MDKKYLKLNELNAVRYQALMEMRTGDLMVIAYKLAGNIYIEFDKKEQLVVAIISLLCDAGEKLAGQTLPADIHVINKLKIKP